MQGEGTVFIVDDDAEVRQSWECVLAAAEMPARSYPTAEAFLAEADYSGACCLVLDLRMPGMGGKRLLETLRERDFTMPVIVISGHADVPVAVEAMKLGLVDFLTKPVAPSLLVAKIRETLRHVAAAQTRRGDEGAVRSRLATLSHREREVLALLARGKLHKQIAQELGISSRTVDHHHAQINVKMAASNVADLMRMAFLAGLL